jgi:mannose-6-phosphate isomerase-like protein (cupin superfamily)
MRAALITGALAALSASAALAAAAPAPAPLNLKDYASSAEVQALIATAKAKRTNEANIVQPLLRFAPYGANLEYRASVGPAAVHLHEAEMFYVVQGAADLVTGGSLVDQTQSNPNNLSGTSIKGGAARHVQAGDFILVPEQTPHQFTSMNPVIVLMSFHVPRG